MAYADTIYRPCYNQIPDKRTGRCGKDLSGGWDCEDEESVHFDHMVSLCAGGLNMCSTSAAAKQSAE